MKPFLAFIAALTACHATLPDPPEPPITVVDAGDETADARRPTCANYCAHLAGLGCAEGVGEQCVRVCEQIQKSGYLTVDIACGLAAKTPSEARDCGTRCIR